MWLTDMQRERGRAVVESLGEAARFAEVADTREGSLEISALTAMHQQKTGDAADQTFWQQRSPDLSTQRRIPPLDTRPVH